MNTESILIESNYQDLKTLFKKYRYKDFKFFELRIFWSPSAREIFSYTWVAASYVESAPR